MGGKRRNLWPVLLAAVIPVVVVSVLYAVWRSPEQRRNDLSTYGAFAVAVVALAAGWMAWAWRRRTRQDGATAGQEELDRLADLLAEAVGKQWEEAASERGLRWPEPIPVRWEKPLAAMAGPVTAAVGSTRFSPLPGLGTVDQQMLQGGDIRDLHAVYGGLASGRLVIAGAPGSGKSGAAVLLVLAALRYRQSVRKQVRPGVPVPVLFTAHDWDPGSQRIEDWLVLQMQRTYSSFAGRAGGVNATKLVDAGKVAVILDGLDEMAETLRPVALQALSQQATFRLVVLARTAEIASATSQRGRLHGAAVIELHAIDRTTAADYLSRAGLDPPPQGWRDLIERLRGDQPDPIARALDNPLTLTLVRDTYQERDNVRELLDFCTTAQQHLSGDKLKDAITDHLLGRVLPAAYMLRPGEPALRYDEATAHRALVKIAARMNQDGRRDLEWWCLPDWAPVGQRIIVVGLVGGLVVGLVGGLVGGLVFGLVTGLSFAFILGFGAGFGGESPGRIGKPRLRRVFGRLYLVGGLVGGLVLGLVGGYTHGLVFGLVGGFAGLGSALLIGFQTESLDRDSTSSLSPITSWRADRGYLLMFGLMVGLLFGLLGGLFSALLHGFGFGLVVGVGGLVGGLVFGLAFGLIGSQSWSATLAIAQLAMSWHTPLRLMRFLEDAHERNVLRTVGPVYQFRHARLQDRLAEQASPLIPAQDPAKATAV
jgi:hypothetical protein